jgi:uncharacterized protein YkwD
MDQRHDREPRSVLVSLTARESRRRLLARLAAVPAAVGLAFLAEREPLDAKKRNGKGKGKDKGKGQHKKHKKHGENGKGHGNGGGGGYSPDSEERKFLGLINDYRRKNGAGALSLQNQLGAAAEHHSRDMAKKNYFKHTLANGDTSEENIERFGYRDWRYIGENIAAGYETASKVMQAWQDSPEHDRNMRNKNFTEIGIGRAHSKSSKYGWYWTTTFGDR